MFIVPSKLTSLPKQMLRKLQPRTSLRYSKCSGEPLVEAPERIWMALQGQIRREDGC